MRVTWHPEAEEEMIEAARFYDRRVPGLGAEYLDEVDAAITRIVAAPDSLPVVENDIRRCRLKRFPYCLYYRVLNDRIRILVVKHHSRHADYWKPRE